MNSDDLRNRLADVLLGDESLDSFEDWFVQSSWNVHKQNDYDLLRLVYAIELRLAEYSEGHLSEPGLRKSLRLLLETLPVHIGTKPSAIEIRSGSSLSINLQPVAFAGQSQFAGISLVGASVS